MSLEDRLLIQDVIARYSYSYDGRDADGFAQLFVEDASFEVIVPTQSRPAVRVLSRAAIRKWAVQRRELTAGIETRHYQSGLLFDELTMNTARTRTMLLVIIQGAADSAPLLQLTGSTTIAGGSFIVRRTSIVIPSSRALRRGSDVMLATELWYTSMRPNWQRSD